MTASYRIAIVHDYLNQMGGAERVVELLHRMFPDAPIFTTIVDRDRLLPELTAADIRTTWMQWIPGILKRSKHFFWLYPFAVESMDLREFDLVISSSSAYAKGARVKGNTKHVCYCHTPMRFAWDFSTYMEANEIPGVMKSFAKWMMLPLRLWDKSTSGSARVHHLIANSSIVQKRIGSHYGRDSSLIFPPVNVTRFSVPNSEPTDDLLVVSRLVAYKRIDLAIEACSRAGRQLDVVGDGPDRKRLEAMAGPTVRFLGRLPDEQVVRYMQRCSALISPGVEDFGITPLEVNACGRPVVAFRGGGALDTIVPEVNGVFFEKQTADSLAEALEKAARFPWDPVRIRKHAELFGEDVFRRKLFALIDNLMSEKDRAPEARVALRPSSDAPQSSLT
jgi:glycosyltransferase involved in cell wall biosynthesis